MTDANVNLRLVASQTPNLGPPGVADISRSSDNKKARLCRFFSSKSGCHAGDKCPFLHDPTNLKVQNRGTEANTNILNPSSTHAGSPKNKSQAVIESSASRVISKPTSDLQVENPREFQLGQIRRRYKPKETKGNVNATILEFRLTPTDPDFPFEMDGLDCFITIPADYPARAPTLKVKNKDIPRGFALNVENGFDGLYRERRGITLLALIAALDRNLEIFLSEKKVETVKLVANADTRHLNKTPVASSISASAIKKLPVILKDPVVVEPVFTAEEKAQADTKRKAEVRQLEARLGRLPLFTKSADGIAYTVPIDPPRKSDLPLGLQAIKTVTLYVPILYPLHTSRIELDGVADVDAKPVQVAFQQRSKESSMNLMAQINNLSINFLSMSKRVVTPEPHTMLQDDIKVASTLPEIECRDTSSNMERFASDKSHIRVIPRPPEWDNFDDAEDDSSDYSYDSGDETEDDQDPDVIELAGLSSSGAMPLSATKSTAQPLQGNTEKGTAISFPFVELYGIELLEITNLSISVKCERCKTHLDCTNLKNDIPKHESCRKCATQLSVTFRRDLVHAHAVRAGFLDLSGCIPVDMLPSNFVPTCSKCSTAYPQPGIVSVRGETTSNICRECHQKFTFKIPEVKFLRITGPDVPISTGPRRKKEVLGLVAGEQLPRRGACSHYSKSLRWFRFSCCQKVYPCDRCHDATEEHPNEHANRMICGFCSREQNYRPENCGVCHGILVAKKGTGFWEGGNGTRDPVKMSRKDPRKFRRAAA